MKKRLLASLLIVTVSLFCGCSSKETPISDAISSIHNVIEETEKDISEVSIEKETEAKETDTKKEVKEEISKTETPKGALSVKGANLVDRDGNPVQLKGLSTHGMAWYPDYINKNLFKEFKETWKADIIRLAMYTEEYGGYCSDGNKSKLLEMIDDGVNYATELDMYAIIDWHILSDNNPNTHKEEAIDFFKTVSKEYKDYTNIFYEICNEPNGNTTWKDIKSYALEIIPVIRENDPDAIIIVGTPRWSQEVDKAAADPITEYDNIMYTLHFYADTHRDDLRKTLKTAADKGLPIFVTEYGICDASGGGAINEEQAEKWMALLDEYKISSCIWNISNKSETCAIFKSSCQKTYGFSDSDLSDSGKWAYKMLTGEMKYDSSEVKFEKSSGSDNKKADSQSQPSKTISAQSGPVSVTLNETGSWESEGKTFTQYDVIITNTNNYDIDSWKADIDFKKDIEVSQGWCANYSTTGKTLHIENADFNGYIKAGDSTKDIGCIIIE